MPLHAPASFELEALLEKAHAHEDNTHHCREHPDAARDCSDASDSPKDRGHMSQATASEFSCPAPPFTRTPAPPARELSKDSYHSKMRAKARRRRARDVIALEHAAGETRPIKLVQKKRRRAAKPLHFSTEDISAVLSHDCEHLAQSRPPPIPSTLTLDANELPVTKNAFIATKDDAAPKDTADHENARLTVREGLALGLEVVPWDGKEPRPILDKYGRVFAVLAGSPRDPQWPDVARQAHALLEAARDDFSIPEASCIHRRGCYPALPVGISYGGGQQYAKHFDTSAHNAAVSLRILYSQPIRRMANFASMAMQAYAPRLHAHYGRTLNALLESDSRLQWNFKNNVFGAAMLNLGPRVITSRHKDHQNLAWGWCSVTALGDFNPQEGGHLVLWDLGIMIEFPPGSTILIPSAILEHSNIDIGRNETRTSFTQYSAGGLFRWVECGMMPQYQFEESGGILLSGEERWRRGVQMYSTWNELCGSV